VRVRIAREPGLCCIPRRAVEDGPMLARIVRALVIDLADVDGVGEQLVDLTASERLATIGAARR